MSRQFSVSLQGLGHGFDWLAILIILSAGLSTATAPFKLVAGWNFLLLASYGLVLYLVVNWLRYSQGLRQRLWLGIVLTGTVTHIVSLALWRPTWEMWTGKDFYSAIRNPFPLGHHNFVGGYCLLMLPLVVGFTLSQTNKGGWLGYGAIALNALALYASGSRGALLGALALGLLALPWYYIHHPPKSCRQWLIVSGLCLLLVAALASNPRVRSLVSFNPSANNAAFSIEQIADGPTQDRLFMLQAGQRIFMAHPLLGIGPGNLSRLYDLYRPVETGGGLELVQQLHNTPAQVLAELGILGISGYLLWLGCLLKIGIALQKSITDRRDRILLYSVGASWFAYSISSLTDYQLENIGIASTLILTSALLIDLANSYLKESPAVSLSRRHRRLLSLGLLLFLSVIIQTWARADAGFYLAHAAQKDVESFNFADADAKWAKASRLIPWDPTYAALSAEQFIDIQAQVTDPKKRELLRTAAIASLKTALQSAPNDPWFNQNLAVLLSKDQPQQAERYLRRAARLVPRSENATYYSLGCTYLEQGKSSQATTAFVLESLANPEFLVDSIWKTQPFSEQLPEVLDQTLATWQQILSETAPGSYQYAWLNQQIAVTQWWYHRPLTVSNPKNLSPFVQAILSIDTDSERSLKLLNETLEAGADDTSLAFALIRAWLTPDQFLPDFLKDFDGTAADKQAVMENIRTHRDLRDWLMSVSQPADQRSRQGLAFAYRNQSANLIRKILSTDGLSSHYLLDQLPLFSSPPREFSQLDQKMVEIANKDLAIGSPSL